MIKQRRPEYEGAPKPPPWIDADRLGAATMTAVPGERVRVIEGGRSGLLRFIATAHPQDLADWDAFVVKRAVGSDAYVFSKEQFALATYLFRRRKWFGPLRRSRIDRQLSRILKIPQRQLRNLPDTSALRRFYRGDSDDNHLKEVAGEVFDIHEYAICEQTTSDPDPSRPGLRLNSTGAIEKVFVADTRSLIADAVGGATADFTSIFGTQASSPASAGHEDLLRRTPHLEPDRQGALPLNSQLHVTVYADKSPPRPGEKVEDIIVKAPPELREFEIGVWLVATEHFTITSAPLQSIVIHRDKDESTKADFAVAVTRGGEAGSLGKLTAIFSYNGRPSGSVSREFEIAGQAPRADDQRETDLLRPKLEMAVTADPADMIVTISNPSTDGRQYDCLVTTRLLPEYANGKSEAWPLPGTTEAIVSQHFKLFTTSGLTDANRIANLRGAGLELFEVAPDHFKDAFWKIIDGGHPLRSISIVSVEPFIPWELMIPNRRRGGHPEARQALGVEFSVGRWISSDYCSPRQKVPLKDSWVFAPKYRGPTPKPLTHAAEEAKFVCDEFPGENISPAVFDGFEKAMAAGGRSLLHFVCHGAARGGGAQAIFSEDNNEFSSTGLRGAAAAPEALYQCKPFVFLNACEVGRTTPALIGVGGFAPVFIDLGASCVVAPLWSVKDGIAHVVAEEFYTNTKANPTEPFARILAKIRQRAYGPEQPEDSYAAYCFYGDPVAAQQ